MVTNIVKLLDMREVLLLLLQFLLQFFSNLFVSFYSEALKFDVVAIYFDLQIVQEIFTYQDFLFSFL